MAKDNQNSTEIIEIKESLAKQEYSLQQNFMTENTINLIIESENQDKKIEDMKSLMELDLDYKERSSKIKNISIAENPIFIVDSKNEKNKRILNYLLWATSIIGIPVLIYSNPVATFFVGTTIVLAVLTVSFNTRLTTTDRRIMSNLLEKLIKNKLSTNRNTNSNRQNKRNK